jgi:hypothetical protein
MDELLCTYQGDRLRSQLTVSIDGQIVNSDESFTLWLNALEYHVDSEKRRAIQRMTEILPLEPLRSIYVMLLLEKAAAIARLLDLVTVIVNPQNSVDVQIRGSE